MSGTTPPNLWGGLGDGLEDYPPDPELMAIYAAIEARLKTGFDRHKGVLLGHLQKVCERTPKPLDRKYAWRHVRFYAWRYLEEEASAEKRMMVPPADRVEQLRQLGNALRKARCKLDETKHHVNLGVLFQEWCKVRGIPDFTDRHVAIFDEALSDLIAGLAYMETAASRAAEQVRPKHGRPVGTGVLQPDFIIDLELAYRDITGKPGGAGPGPFAQFLMKFLKALGRCTIEKQTVIKVIRAAKQSERWGRSPLADFLGGKTPSSSL
jgi:hypothetical protein